MREEHLKNSVVQDVGGGGVAACDILAIRHGPGANCSSIGSALDLLFLSAVAAGAIFAGVAAAFGDGAPPRSHAPADDDEGPDASAR